MLHIYVGFFNTPLEVLPAIPCCQEICIGRSGEGFGATPDTELSGFVAGWR
jgi:hypothetical protein